MVRISSIILMAGLMLGAGLATTPCNPNDDSSCSTIEPDSSTLLQAKASIAVGGSKEEAHAAEGLDFSAEAIKKRHDARKKLIIEQDLSKLHHSHYRQFQNGADETLEAFNAFLSSTGLDDELTNSEKTLFFNRFKDKIELLLKQHNFDPSHPNFPVWTSDLAQALQLEKPVMTEQFCASINNASLGYTVVCQPWMENEAQEDYDAKRGRGPSGDPSLLDFHASATYNVSASVETPSEFDPASEWSSCGGVIKAVHNQGTCGSCWAFAAMSAIDSQLCIKSNGAFSGPGAILSRSYATSCSGYSNGCAGGWSNKVFTMFTNNFGVSGGETGCVPYFGSGSGTDHFNAQEGAPPCMTQCVPTFTSRSFAQDQYRFPGLTWSLVWRQSGVQALKTALKQALVQSGPIPFGIYADNGFMGYSSGIYSGDCTTSANHAVTAIGYGTTWVHGMNSWGPNWGEGGMFKVADCVVTDIEPFDIGTLPSDLPNPIVPGTVPSPPTPAPPPSPPAWSITNGPCSIDDVGCIMSPNYDAATHTNYGNLQMCTIQVESGSDKALEVMDFNTEANKDWLQVNGVKYYDANALHGMVPQGQMVWSSDDSVTNSGWKICAHPGPICSISSVTVTTGGWGSEVSWQINKMDGTSSCASSQQYQNNQEYEIECCLGSGSYNLVCLDSYGDGWNGGKITINSVDYCGSTSGLVSVLTQEFTISNGFPTPAPPAPTPATPAPTPMPTPAPTPMPTPAATPAPAPAPAPGPNPAPGAFVTKDTLSETFQELAVDDEFLDAVMEKLG